MVAMFMQHRRKTLKACTKFAPEDLAGIEKWEEVFAKAEIDYSKRPENIAAGQYVELANIIESIKNQ
jgi:16S rRNA A1518/A1519 N6-dimethyltransferase RsmA/KsgA/DIM1 with predicted DNA glycosylase/AP lyase activity